MTFVTFGADTSPSLADLDANFAQIAAGLDYSGMRLQPGAIASYMLVKAISSASASRLYVVPNGDPAAGTRAAIKVFFDDYEADYLAGDADYRDFGLYTDSAIKGPNGAGTCMINSKTNGDFFGFVPQIGLARSDGSEIALRAVTINTNISESDWASFVATFQGNHKPGKTYAIGDTICSSSGKAYAATTPGAAGSTRPSHTSGTVSDGGVTWQFLWDNAAGGGSGIKMFVVLGRKDDALWWSNAVPKDAGAHITRDAVLYNGKGLYVLDGFGVPVGRLISPAGSFDMYLQHPTSTSGLRLNFQTDPFVQYVGMAELLSNKSDSSNSTTPNVGACQQISFGYSGSVSVTSFTGGKAYQRLVVRGGTGTVTLVNGANLVTNTGADKVLTASSCLEFIANSTGTIFTELGKL